MTVKIHPETIVKGPYCSEGDYVVGYWKKWNGTDGTKWKMSRKPEMEDQWFLDLEVSKFQNVLILLPNKWRVEEKLPPSHAHKTSIKEVISKSNTKAHIMETIGYRPPPQQNMSSLFRNALSNHITLSTDLNWKLLLMDAYSIWSLIRPILLVTKRQWLLLLTQLINMLQERLESIMSISANGKVRQIQI